jgi:pyrimidine deaminase RibD-like protein
MTKQDEIKKILNSLSIGEAKWSYSFSWVDRIEQKYKKSLSLKNVRDAHSVLYQELINDLLSSFKSSSWIKSLPKDIIEDEVIKSILKLETHYNPDKGAVEKTFLEFAINNSLKNKLKNHKKKSLTNDFDNIEPIQEHQIINTSFLNDIQELDGDKCLAKFLKNISIAEKRKFNEEKDLLNFELKINRIDKTVFYDDLGNKYNPGKYSFVPNHFKYQTICETPHRIEMFKARDLVEESKSNFHNTVIQPLRNKGDFEKANKKEKNTPVLSAVALDKRGDIIKTAYKGQCGEMKHHCEFTLFESVFEEEDWFKIKGGTVFVTLEPCHKRGIDSETGNPKIPCAVRCLESGIDTIYIAHHDPDESVKGHGIKTLETGQYTFKKDYGILSANGFPDLHSALRLQKYFEDKGYRKVLDDDNKIAYQVGKPVNVKLFHTDIALQIMKINKSFLKNKFPEAFITTSLV